MGSAIANAVLAKNYHLCERSCRLSMGPTCSKYFVFRRGQIAKRKLITPSLMIIVNHDTRINIQMKHIRSLLPIPSHPFVPKSSLKQNHHLYHDRFDIPTHSIAYPSHIGSTSPLLALLPAPFPQHRASPHPSISNESNRTILIPNPLLRQTHVHRQPNIRQRRPYYKQHGALADVTGKLAHVEWP